MRKEQRTGGNGKFGIEQNEFEDPCGISKQKFPVENNTKFKAHKRGPSEKELDSIRKVEAMRMDKLRE